MNGFSIGHGFLRRDDTTNFFARVNTCMLTSKYVSSPSMAISSQSKRAPRRRRTQAQRRELSDQRMIDAAFKLIERQGGSRTTLVEIGELSGYSHGLVSHRFGSKGALVRAVTERLQHDFAKMLEPALAGRHGMEALARHGRNIFAQRPQRAIATRCTC